MRKGVFIPDITVEMFKNTTLEAVEEFMVSGQMEDIEIPERPHGKWEFIGNNLFKCTHCGYIADAYYLREWKVHTYDAEFPTACLKCGADMRKEGEAE